MHGRKESITFKQRCNYQKARVKIGARILCAMYLLTPTMGDGKEKERAGESFVTRPLSVFVEF